MTLKKHGTCQQAKISTCLYKCPSCGHVDTGGQTKSKKICPKCNTEMTLVSCSIDG